MNKWFSFFFHHYHFQWFSYYTFINMNWPAHTWSKSYFTNLFTLHDFQSHRVTVLLLSLHLVAALYALPWPSWIFSMLAIQFESVTQSQAVAGCLSGISKVFTLNNPSSPSGWLPQKSRAQTSWRLASWAQIVSYKQGKRRPLTAGRGLDTHPYIYLYGLMCNHTEQCTNRTTLTITIWLKAVSRLRIVYARLEKKEML